MVAQVRISATPELEAIEPTIEEALGCLQDRLNALPPAEVVAVVEAATRALAPVSPPSDEQAPAIVAAITAGRSVTTAERVEAAVDVLLQSFTRRRALLTDALSTSQVAVVLNTSRQTPHDRMASGTLLAVMDRGALRFPPWQFDADGADGVVAGLPAVIQALDVSPMAKVSWLTRANPMLDGETPLALLKDGQVDRIIALARSVGIA